MSRGSQSPLSPRDDSKSFVGLLNDMVQTGSTSLVAAYTRAACFVQGRVNEYM